MAANHLLGHSTVHHYFLLLLLLITVVLGTVQQYHDVTFHDLHNVDLTAFIKPGAEQQQQQEEPSHQWTQQHVNNHDEYSINNFDEYLASTRKSRTRSTTDSENEALKYFRVELESRPYQTFTLYLSSQLGVDNATCENSQYPCPSISQALARLDVLVMNWTRSMNESIFNQQQFNIHVQLEFTGKLTGFCNNEMVTPIYSNINYLFEIYSESYFNVLSCNQFGTSLFLIRNDMTRFYFHDLRLNAAMTSSLNYNFGIYNSIMTFSRISVANYQVYNFSSGDVIFEEVYCTKEAYSLDFSNVKTVKFKNVVFVGAIGFTFTFANCGHVEVSETYFDFLSFRAVGLKTLEIKDSICIGSNIVITKADSTLFSNTKFQISKYYLPALAVEFVDKVKITNCVAQNLDLFAQLGAILNLMIEYTTIFDCNVLDTYKNVKSVVEITSVSETIINHSEFYRNIGNEGGVLGFRDIVSLNMDNCTFADNRAIAFGGAISIASFSENAYFTESFIANSTFIRNGANTFGGAIFLTNSFIMKFINCLFKENLSLQSGGALFIRQDMLVTQFENTKFIGNYIKREVGNAIAGMLLGCGGALTIHSIGHGPGSYGGAEFIGNRAIRGGALCVGYFTYWNRSPYLFKDFTLIDNFANMTGGAFYFFEQSILVSSVNNSIIGPGNTFRGNRASMFGDDFSSIGRNLTIDYVSPSVESGQNITIEMGFLGNLGLELPLQSENFKIISDYLQINSSIAGNKRFIASVYFTKAIYENTTANVKIISESLVTTNFNITLLPCPMPLRMVAEFVNEQQIFVCKNVIDLETLIISITVPVGILMLLGGTILGFLIFYCTSKIISKLRLLKRKENAEKNLEKTILDNKIVFEMSDSETNYTHSRSTSYYKSKHNSDYDSPLLENDHMNQNTVKSSVVIPVQDIEITKRIGEGGYGNVYKGLWVNTEVAIKSLKTAEGSFEFEKEAAILSRLRHPNIVSFYGVCITETSKYMITEFVKKGSLDKIIYKCKQNIEFLSLKEKINILIGVSNGMNYLHSLQPSVIHRDLKPANILLDESNNCKVCDFGLVKIIGNNQLQTSMTVNVGTLFYIGNEGLQGSSTKITHKVDVYSFGIVMYELYFLENPYLNAASSKIHHFRKATCEDQPYTVPMKVLNNERPIIPFRNDEELHEWMNVYGQETSAPFSVLKSVTEDYTKLMQQCWDMDPSNRPEFSDISKQLIQLRDKLSF